MADLFDGILPFVHTARHKSFVRAGEQLGVTSAAVSKAVARLEEQLGVRLLHRTTRRVSLSQEGEMFLQRCEAAIAEVRVGRDLVTMAQKVPRGDLTVSLPFVLGKTLVRRLAPFGVRYPSLRVHLRLTDSRARLVDDRVDVAIRVGDLPDSSLIARRVLRTRWVTVASRAYLARRGRPESPDDLREHDCLRFVSPRRKPVDWAFRDPQRQRSYTVAVEGSLDMDQGELLVDAAAEGLGVAQVFDLMVEDRIRTGELEEILDEYAAPGPDVHALCLPEQRRTPKVRAFLDFLAPVT